MDEEVGHKGWPDGVDTVSPSAGGGGGHAHIGGGWGTSAWEKDRGSS